MNINISLSKVTVWQVTSRVWFEVLPASLLRTQVFWATYYITVWVAHTISMDHNAFLFVVTKSSLQHWPLPTTPVTQHHFPEGLNPQVKSCSRVSKISHFIIKSKMALKPTSPPIHSGVTRILRLSSHFTAHLVQFVVSFWIWQFVLQLARWVPTLHRNLLFHHQIIRTLKMVAAGSSVTLLSIYKTICHPPSQELQNLLITCCFHIGRWNVPDIYFLHLFHNAAALFYNCRNSVLFITWSHFDTGIGLFTNNKVREKVT